MARKNGKMETTGKVIIKITEAGKRTPLPEHHELIEVYGEHITRVVMFPGAYSRRFSTKYYDYAIDQIDDLYYPTV